MSSRTGRTWVEKRGMTPYIDAALITVNAYYGLNVFSKWTRNANPALAPVYVRKSGMREVAREWDMHDRDLCLVKKGCSNGQRISSLNGVLVRKDCVRHNQKIRRYIFDNYAFGGISMDTVEYIKDGRGFQVKQVTFIYGGNVSLVNPNTEDFDAFTVICWDIPKVDDAGYPIKAQRAGRNTTHAGLMWSAYKTTVDDAERDWIKDAMLEYVNTGIVGEFDHPLKEGSAHLLDAICGSTLVLMEAMKKMGINNVDQQINLMKQMVTPSSNLKRSYSGNTRMDHKTQKKQLVEYLFGDESDGLSETAREQQKGNSTVRYATASRRINQDQDSRVIGMTLGPVKGGGLVEMQVGRTGYTNS